MLFLFDEPDVHLNESWTIEFVNLIHDFYRMSETERDSRLEHELLVATHSSMILTDVDCDQIYHFSNDITDSHVKVGPSSISPFGASRDEISKQIFGTDSSIGHYTLDVLQRFDKENLDDFIKKLGPGYLRFRLLDLQRNSSSE